MALAKDTVTEFLVALPMNLVRKWKENAPAAIGLRTRIFTGVKVGCGIGACRGCYIDSSALPQGIPVCQEGPFLPAMSIDYEKDQKFLAHYL